MNPGLQWPAEAGSATIAYVIPITIARYKSAIARFALATIRAAMHKDRAFQASSPKNFSGQFFGTGLFFAEFGGARRQLKIRVAYR